jgi:5-methylcytosine-specific restriction endonuclease McrA
MPRTVAEWIGKTDDSVPPKSVRVRIFLAHERRCHITGREIRAGEAWDLEHVKPLWLGGENRESNLAPALKEPHREKTKKEAGERAKSNAQIASVYGIKKPKARIPSPPRAPRSTTKLDSIRALGPTPLARMLKD